MRLQELGSKATAKRINRINESRFGFSIDYNRLSIEKAQALSEGLKESLNQLRRSYGFHSAEKNPKYMELLMVREGLLRYIEERTQPLNESELGKSEAILAAKDIVDTIQDMIEDVSKIQNEQLPALIDTIRDQIGTEQAESFKGTLSGVLSSMLTQLQDAREQTDTASRSLAGEQVAQPMDMGGAAAAPGAEMPGAAPAMGPDSDLDSDEFAAADAAAGGEAELGREKR